MRDTVMITRPGSPIGLTHAFHPLIPGYSVKLSLKEKHEAYMFKKGAANLYCEMFSKTVHKQRCSLQKLKFSHKVFYLSCVAHILCRMV